MNSDGAERLAGDDERLIEAYLAGRPHAVRRVEGWIGAELAARFPALARRAEEREDLCQTLHQRLLVNLRRERFGRRSSLRTYVARITRYAAIDLLRYRDRRPEEQTPDGAPVPSHRDTPERAAEREERRRTILRALQRSPERCRQLWRMIFVDGLGYREIADRLGIPEGTVKSRAWTCRRHLKELLAEPSPASDDRDSRKDGAR
jgi:RNA polymerase sigma-70 factor (ECF subfamily)